MPFPIPLPPSFIYGNTDDNEKNQEQEDTELDKKLTNAYIEDIEDVGGNKDPNLEAKLKGGESVLNIH